MFFRERDGENCKTAKDRWGQISRDIKGLLRKHLEDINKVESESNADVENPHAPQEYAIKSINGELKLKLLKNYNIWQNIKQSRYSQHVNILKGISEVDFLDMVRYAKFMPLLEHRKGITQRVRGNIIVLKSVLGKEWAEQAAKNIGTTLAECQKRVSFPEYSLFK